MSEIAVPSLARGAAAITVATLLTRVTGYARVVVLAAVMGATYVANTYQTANTAPSLLFELLAAGVLTSVFVPTFVEYLVTDRHREGWHVANVLCSVSLVALSGIAIALAIFAPLVMRLLTLGIEDASLRAQEIHLGSQFLRLLAPQVVFYGMGMILTSALHARRRFLLGALAPVFNNVVVITVYLAYAYMRDGDPPTLSGTSASEVWLLGLGTTFGVVAMTVCLIPQLRRLGWRFGFVWDLGHEAVRKAARLGVWALGYAGGYQAGLIIVLILANRVEGGVAAYQWAFTLFVLPHSLFAVPIFSVLFTAMSEHAAREEEKELQRRLTDGLSSLSFILLPVAALIITTAKPLAFLTLEYGVMTAEGVTLVGRCLALLAVGLPTYSAFLVFTRAFYAIGETKVPALVNLASIVVGGGFSAVFFFTWPNGWEVPGLALGHSIGFALGLVVLTSLASRAIGHVSLRSLVDAVFHPAVGAVVAFVAMAAVRYAFGPVDSKTAAGSVLMITAGVGALAYLTAMRAVRAPQLSMFLRALKKQRAH